MIHLLWFIYVLLVEAMSSWVSQGGLIPNNFNEPLQQTARLYRLYPLNPASSKTETPLFRANRMVHAMSTSGRASV